MDFDDHDDGDDEGMPISMAMPVSSSYEAPPLSTTGLIGGAEKPPGEPGSRAKATGCGARYRECLKNHAVGIGGHAVDGCGEFIAAGEEGSIDALRCAACSCHRNFHRRESEFNFPAAVAEASPFAPLPYGAMPPHHHHQFSPYYRTPAGYLHNHHHMAAAAAAGHPRPLLLPSTSHSGRDDVDDVSGMAAGPMSAVGPLSSMSLGAGPSAGGGGYLSAGSGGRKRFRTKFTQEQKDRMLAFAEHLGWRIQKHDEAAVQQFCDELGVKRHVLKVWMHNNKHTLGKKPPTPGSI